MLDWTQAKLDEMTTFETSSNLLFMMKFLSDEIDIIFFKSEAYSSTVLSGFLIVVAHIT